MGNLVGNLINFFTSPLGFAVIFAVIGGLGRAGAWWRDQRIKRAAWQARQARELEGLRTGRQSDTPAPASSNSAGDHQARLRALQEQRAAQLRELQQKRLAELRAKRAAQQGGVATPTPPPMPARQAPARATPAKVARPTAQQAPRRPVAPTQRPPARTQRPTPTPAARPPEPAFDPYRQAPQHVPHRAQVPAPLDTEPHATRVTLSQGGGATPAPIGPGALLASREDLRRAIVATEVLGPPVALRDPDTTGIF